MSNNSRQARRVCRKLWCCLLLGGCTPDSNPGTPNAVVGNANAVDRNLLRHYLLCEECQHGELDSILEPDRRDRLVPLLAQAAHGLTVRQRTNLQRQFEEIYWRLAQRATAEGRAMPLTQDDYVSHFLSNHEATYQARSVVALAAIATPEAKEALQQIADAVTSGALIVRGDVAEEVATAVGQPLPPTPGAGGGPPASTVAWTTITAGAFRTCAVSNEGKAFCWGRNDQGQLGDGTNSTRLKPTKVAGHVIFSSIAASVSQFHTCGVSADSLVYCWGANSRGELGDGSTTPHGVPKPVSGAIKFAGITVGGNHACAWTAVFRVYCWGGNHAGQLGDASTLDRHEPVLSGHGIGVRSVRAGTFHTCADSINSRLYCWGENSDGQLGDDTHTQRLLPVQVVSPLRFRSLSLGASHSCALTRGSSPSNDGLGYCVGLNDHGRLGDGTGDPRNTLVPVEGGFRFLAISAGEAHTCGIVVSTHQIRCWGDNAFGQLGDGTTMSHPLPTLVVGSFKFVAVSAGAGHTCAVTSHGKAYCWGRNTEGQLGDGMQVNNPVPTAVAAP